MADFLVLEEDGTSHLELEESSSDFLLEDGGLTFDKTGLAKAGSFGAGVTPAVPASRATWKTGIITTPTGGTTSVTGLGGTPKAVFFFGTNWTTEDSAVTTSHTGLFRGMAAPKYDAPATIYNSSACVLPAGDASHAAATGANNLCINMLDTSGGLSFLYVAGVSFFDPDGFTLSWGSGSASGHKVVYVALMNVRNVGSFIGATNTTISLGWKAGASLLHGAFGGPDVGEAAQTAEFYGGAAYPGTDPSDWASAGMSAFCTQGSGSTILELRADLPTVRVVSGGHGGIAGTYVPSDIFAAPEGTGLEDLSFKGDTADGGMIVAWDDDDSATGFGSIPASTGNTTTVGGLPFKPGLVLFYSISDEPDLFANYGAGNGRGANGFGVATDDFQWSALVDGVSSRGSFQSFQRGFTDCVNGTNAHAGTVELTADGFILTTAEDDASSGSLLWHAFGHPKTTGWLPQLYRRRNRP